VNVTLDAGALAYLTGGTGVVIESGIHYCLESPADAIAIAVESERLKAMPLAISTPSRIWGQCWPGEE
jgi:hypothetical protein